MSSNVARMDRWVLEIAAHLAKQGFGSSRPTYDGESIGDRLALPLSGPERGGELLIRRVGEVAMVAMLVSDAEMARALAVALQGQHANIPRIQNGRRKFWHRVERMAQHLAAELALRSADAPADALAKLQRLLPSATLWVGIEVRYPSRGPDPTGEEAPSADASLPLRAGLRRRYRTRYAVPLPSRTGVRAALWSSNLGRFEPSPVSRRWAIEQVRAAGEVPDAFALALVLSTTTKGDGAQVVVDTLGATADVVETAAEAVEAAGACADVGGLDLPDCGGIDLPDCSV